ncbi:MAG: hypothetical protein MJ152_01490, partial [Clostridia bacterium]|nr:hypothetical protein [Clostridia bacterium]
MTKKRSTFLFVLFAIILVICLVASFVSFTYPFAINGNYYRYSSFLENVKLGEDLSSSFRVVYSTKLAKDQSSANYDELLESTMIGLTNIVETEGYHDVYVAKSGDNNIVLEVGNIMDKTNESFLINLIGEPETLTFYTKARTSADETPDFYARYIKRVIALEQYNSQAAQKVFGIEIDFKDEYKSLIEQKTTGASSIYAYFGDSTEPFFTLTIDSAVTNGTISFSSSNFTSKADATTYANKIKSGALDLELTKLDSATISPSYGRGASLTVGIALLVLLLAGFVFLIVKYRHMGWLACFNLLFYVTLGMFFIQSIPLAHINFAGVVGIVLATVVAFDCLISIFETAKKHYNAETKLYVAFKMALKETLFKTCLSNGLLFIVGLICVFMPVAAITSFGWILLVLPLVTVFTTLVLMRLFINMYLAINNT